MNDKGQERPFYEFDRKEVPGTDLCPVAISVESEDAGNSKDTGDAIGKNMHMWIALMAVSAVAVVSLVVVRRKVQ